MPEPYAAGADGPSAIGRGRDRTSDLLSGLGLAADLAAVVAFVGYWVAAPDTTEAWFTVTLTLMGVGLLLGLGALVLSSRRRAPRGRALAAMWLALLPIAFVVLLFAAKWGAWLVQVAIYRVLGPGS